MRVSVIIPHYDMADFLPRAVQSVKDQGDLVRDLTVVDDGSPEEAWLRALEACGDLEFDEEHWCRYEQNRGQAFALNDALDSVLGNPYADADDAIAFLDADDEWTHEKLKLQVAVLESEPDIDIVFGHGHEVETIAPGAQFWRHAKPAPLLSAMLIRRKAMAKVGYFKEDLGAGTMIEWLDRVYRARMKSRMLEETVYIRHVHGKNYGVVHRDQALREYANAIRLIRERNATP